MNGAVVSIVIPISLAFIMFGMGASLRVSDFSRVLAYPKAVMVGLFGQIILLPLVGYLFVMNAQLAPELAVGVMVLVACAGGPISNTITYLVKGDLALSVTLTAMSSCITIITIPFVVNFALFEFMGATEETALPIGSTNMRLFAITLFPVLLGMTFRHYYSDSASRMERSINRIAALFFALLFIGVLVKERAGIMQLIATAGPVAYGLNCVTMLLGFSIARLLRLNQAQSLTVSLEVGLQNCATGIFIATTILHSTEIASVSAAYTLVMFLNAGLLVGVAGLFRARKARLIATVTSG